MTPYLLIFFLSAFCIYLGEHLAKSDKASCFASKVFVLIGLLLPSLLAGFRDVGVGLDTAGYGIAIFNAAILNSSFHAFSQAITGWNISFAFQLFSFITIRLTGSLVVFFAAIELLILAPTYLAIKNFSSGRYVWLTMLAYYFEFYCLGLSGMRQFVAMAFFVYAISLLWCGKRKISLVWLAIAVLCHTSAIIGFGYCLLWLLMFKKCPSGQALRRGWRFATAAVLVFYALVPTLAAVILPWLIGHVSVFAHYSGYINRASGSDYVSFYLFVGAMLVVCLFLGWSSKAWDQRAGVLALMVISALVLYSLQSIDTDFTRTAWYSWYLIIPLFAALNTRSRAALNCPSVAFLSITITNFAWYYVINGYYGCVPYISTALGI